MSGPRLAAVLSAGLIASCNLVVSLDDLQDGAGGASSGTQSIAATATNATSTASATATVASTTAAATGGGGGGGEAPGYDDCVESLGPVVRLRLDDAGGDSETNLGAWGGSADYTGGRTSEAPLAAGSLAAASFAPDGVLQLAAQGGFFGGSQAFTIELWFQPPADYSEEVAALITGTDGFVLRIEKRLDAMGLDSIRFRFFGNGGGTDRVVIENLDLSGGGVHHVVAVYQEAPFMSGEADDLQIYVDGAPPTNLATGTETAMPALNGSLTFGNGFAGPIDELSIYPAALDPAAIEALHTLGMGQSATCPPP
ncbi:MAG: LamG domain-containing protein [Polyangiaceae bacterium]|nr:LamG domain-containing protein [Polyangiaceae bacterium]